MPIALTTLLITARPEVVDGACDAMEVVAHQDAPVPAENGHVGELDDGATEIQEERRVVKHEINRPDARDLLH